MKTGLAFIISGPSTVGKTRIIRYLRSQISEIHISISATTREIRADETINQDYYFLSEEEFKLALNRGEFLEWVETPTGYYGTLKNPNIDWLVEGHSVIFDVDPIGTTKIKSVLSQQSNVQVCSIFLLPPSLDTTRELLKRRGRERGIYTDEDIEKRLLAVKGYIEHALEYDYIIINHNLSETMEIIKNIYFTEKLRSQKNYELYQWRCRESDNLIMPKLSCNQ